MAGPDTRGGGAYAGTSALDTGKKKVKRDTRSGTVHDYLGSHVGTSDAPSESMDVSIEMQGQFGDFLQFT